MKRKNSAKIFTTTIRNAVVMKPTAIEQLNKMMSTPPMLFGEPDEVDQELAEDAGKSLNWDKPLSKQKWEVYRNKLTFDMIERKFNYEEFADFINAVHSFQFVSELNLRNKVHDCYYEGVFQRGGAKRTGIGRRIDSTGHIYEGMLRDDQKHGYGRYITSNGDVKIGQFRNDMLVVGMFYNFDNSEKKKVRIDYKHDNEVKGFNYSH